MTTTSKSSRWVFTIVFAIFLLPQHAAATIQYTISLAHPDQHSFHVTMTVPNIGRELIVAMPAWNATYDIRDFAYRVTDVRAESPDSHTNLPLHIVKLDKQTWRITAPRNSQTELGSVTIQYDDFWDEPGPFSSQLSARHAFLNLAEVLFYIPTRRAEETDVQYADVPDNWRVAQELPAGKSANAFVAPSYDALVDAPAEIGAFREFQFDANGAHFRVVVDGKDWDQQRLTGVLRKIVSYETAMMRDIPFHEYMFIFHFGSFGEAGGGGMEHANCTAIAVPSGDTAANVAAHEFFHLWNVKRIRPQTLQPVDYTKEMWTRSLWFAEGVTSTYAAYAMVRTGLWNHDQFYDDLARQFTTLDSRPAQHWQSAEESSLDTWLDKYDYYDRPAVSISYYNKGQILGVLLDLEIRDATGNRKSLDDVLRAMDDDYAHRNRFYNDSAGVEQEAEKVAGRSLKDFFAKYVAGTDDIPYDDFLRVAGLAATKQQQSIADFGFEISGGRGGPPQIAAVTPGSNAQQAGLQVGDFLLKLDGQPFPRFTQRWLLSHAPGETVKLQITRNATQREISLTLGEQSIESYSISEIPGATAKQKQIRDGILNGTTN
ncbi:MAG TPA: PDZ domain-containing protein [Candidatus Acidoferrales bacterium]|nr:PDZ domain-containing protein [Candidatus Acidoferrales bacterium]